MKRRALTGTILIVVLVAAALATAVLARADSDDDAGEVRGGGTTIVKGGTGPSGHIPVLTKFALHWRGGEGGFECLALAPNSPSGPDSGEFETNAMYVTGKITSVKVRGETAVLKGTSTVTGLGAGTNRPFTATVTRGGPGASLVLKVSGLTFDEILIEGEIVF